MKHTLARSSISIVTKYCFVLIVFFVSSCTSQHQAISITAQPVFSEKDSFVTTTGNTVITKYDYFLVTGNLTDKEKIKKAINDFSDRYSHKGKIHCDDYFMFFYKNSAAVNEDVIKNTEEKYRYKIFDKNKEDDCIGAIDYRDSITTFRDWSSKYE